MAVRRLRNLGSASEQLLRSDVFAEPGAGNPLLPGSAAENAEIGRFSAQMPDVLPGQRTDDARQTDSGALERHPEQTDGILESARPGSQLADAVHKRTFGDDYQNFGNSEPDGHGLTMMSIANVWRNGGADPQWVLDNWTYVNEAVHYIDWAMKNPDISFNKNGLMYGETEAAMMDYTMFANIPCYLGVRMYVEMAQAAGKTREATVWTELADRMERAILDGFSDGRQWNPEKFGFFHDPSMSIYADYVGYDVRNDAPAAWYSLCDNTYRSDIDRYIGNAFFGPRGLGYDHNIITQTSMLLDRSDDYDRFLTNLSKLCVTARGCRSRSSSRKARRTAGSRECTGAKAISAISCSRTKPSGRS